MASGTHKDRCQKIDTDRSYFYLVAEALVVFTPGHHGTELDSWFHSAWQ